MLGLFFERVYGSLELWQWLALGALIAVALPAGWVLERLALAAARRLAKVTGGEQGGGMVEAARGPARFLFAAAILGGTVGPLSLPPKPDAAIDTLARSLAIVSAGWFLVRFLLLWVGHAEQKAAADPNPFRARRLQTQLGMLRRLAGVVIYTLSGALFLMQFSVVRTVGVSLLASAGIAGLAVGFAAQRSLATLLAGIQLSITQPIRIGDSIVVEGEFGTVEEIGLTYVIVKVWDFRRLVIPMNYFLEKPFQNWTRGSTDILGTVSLQTDFSADVEALRRELKRILENEGKALWDGKSHGLQVTDSTHQTMTVRIVVSAVDPSTSFDLKCLVRERMLAFLAQNPRWLPTLRNVGGLV